MDTGHLAVRERAISAEPGHGAGHALLGSAGFVGRQLGGALAIIVLVWLVVMLFRHVSAVAYALAGVVLVLGGAALFVRNQSLPR
jgi:hypothetical protein